MPAISKWLVAACLATSSLATPISVVGGNDTEDIVLNVHGKHNIIVNELVDGAGFGASCEGTSVSGGATAKGGVGQGGSSGFSAESNASSGPSGIRQGLAGASGQSASAPAPTVLTPGCDPSIDRSSLEHLVVRKQQDIYFQQAGSTAGQNTVATVKVPELIHPAVQLQISSEIQQVTCSGGSMNVQFRNKAAYDAALKDWTEAGTFIAISYSEGCGSGYSIGQQDFMVVTNISGDGSANIKATIQVTDFQGAVGHETIITVDIGTFTPTNGTGFNVTDGSAGPGKNNGTAAGNGTDNDKPSGLSNFDANLDASIGFVSFDDPDYKNQFFPPLRSGPVRRSQLKDRGFFDVVGDWVKDVGDVANTVLDTMGKQAGEIFNQIYDAADQVKDTADDIVEKATDSFREAVDEVENLAMQALDDLDRLTSINKELSDTFNIDERPSNADTRWGSAYKLYEGNGVKAYCVGCGVSGQVTLGGSLSFSIANGFSSGKLSANGNLQGIAKLGVEADLEIDYEVPEQVIAQVALSDLVLAGVLQIGPAVKLSAGADLGFKAEGNLLAGVTLDWPAVSASIDIASAEGAQISGWQPNVTPAFQAEGSLTAKVEPYIKIALEMTLSLLQGRFEKSVALIDQPSIIAEANVAGKAGYEDGQLTGEFTNGCAGVAVSGKLRNQLYVDLVGLKRLEIYDWTSDPVTRCLGRETQRRTLSSRQLTVDGANTTSAAVNTTSAAVNSTSAAVNTTETLSVVYSIMQSLSGNLDLHAAEDGNLYAISSDNAEDPVGEDSSVTSSLFETLKDGNNTDTIIGDSHARILHAYTDTLDKWGISRLRFSALSAIPQTAKMIQLEPANNPFDEDGLDIMIGKDTAANIYFLVTCVYDEYFPKVFLVKPDDVESELDMLMSGAEDVVSKVTGPGVESCGLVPFGNGIDEELARDVVEV